MLLHIFTLNWEGASKLSTLYKSLTADPNQFFLDKSHIEWKWWIKDNGSKDDSIKTIHSWIDSRVEPIAYPNNNQNFSQGNNHLCGLANPNDDDLILLLNNDVVFGYGDSLSKMIAILKADPKVGIVGTKLNYCDRPALLQHAGVVWCPVGLNTPINYRAGKEQGENDKKNRYFPMTTAACLLIRASLYKKLNGLDEKFFWCWEDTDLCLRAEQEGYKTVVCGDTKVYHEESASLKKNPVNKLFFSSNTKLFMDRWRKNVDPTLYQKYEQDPTFAIYKQI